jgi:hypothetical protein
MSGSMSQVRVSDAGSVCVQSHFLAAVSRPILQYKRLPVLDIVCRAVR